MVLNRLLILILLLIPVVYSITFIRTSVNDKEFIIYAENAKGAILEIHGQNYTSEKYGNGYRVYLDELKGNAKYKWYLINGNESLEIEDFYKDEHIEKFKIRGIDATFDGEKYKISVKKSNKKVEIETDEVSGDENIEVFDSFNVYRFASENRLQVRDMVWVEASDFSNFKGKIHLPSVYNKVFYCEGDMDNPFCYFIDKCGIEPCFKIENSSTVIYLDHFSGGGGGDPVLQFNQTQTKNITGNASTVNQVLINSYLNFNDGLTWDVSESPYEISLTSDNQISDVLQLKHSSREQKTLEYYIYQDMTQRSANTDLNGTFTIYIPEKNPQIKSAYVEVKNIIYNTQITAGQTIIIWNGTQNTTLLTTSAGFAATGEQMVYVITANATPALAFINSPGQYTFNLFTRLNAIRQGESAKLVLTYEYDSDSPRQIKTVKFFVGQLTSPLAVGSSTNFQIPPLNLPERNIQIRDSFFETYIHLQPLGTVDENININLDGNNAISGTPIDNAGTTTIDYFFLYKNIFDTNTAHTLNFQPTAGYAIDTVGTELTLTYEYDANSPSQLKTIKYLIGQDPSIYTASNTITFSRMINIPNSTGIISAYNKARFSIAYASGAGTAAYTTTIGVNSSVQGQSTPQTSYTLGLRDEQVSTSTILYNATGLYSLTDGSTVLCTLFSQAINTSFYTSARGCELTLTYIYSSPSRIKTVSYFADETFKSALNLSALLNFSFSMPEENPYVRQAYIDVKGYTGYVTAANILLNSSINRPGRVVQSCYFRNTGENRYDTCWDDVTDNVTSSGSYQIIAGSGTATAVTRWYNALAHFTYNYTGISERNTSWYQYSFSGDDYSSIKSISAILTVSYYNPTASNSSFNSNNRPDIEVSFWNGTHFVGNYYCNLHGLSSNLPVSNAYNCTVNANDPSILNAWLLSSNRLIRLRGVWLDTAEFYSDEINISAVYTQINRTFYKLEIEHNSSISFPGSLISVNASINFSSTTNGVYNMSIFNFAENKWDSSFCQNVSALQNNFYLISCNVTLNPNNYISSGIARVKIESTSDDIYSTIREDYVQFYTNSMETLPPQIFLYDPINNARLRNQDISFNFTVIDDFTQQMTCSLYLDGSNESSMQVENNTFASIDLYNIPFGNHTWFVNCTDGEMYNSSEQRHFNLGTPPFAKIEHPIFESFDEHYTVPIIANITDPDGIKTSYVRVLTPNHSLIYEDFINTQPSDDFSSSYYWKKEGDNFDSRICVFNINQEYSGKAFTGISGSGQPNTEMTAFLCSAVSKSIVYGDFDINISFEIMQELGKDYAINFQIMDIPSSSYASKLAFISLSNWTGYNKGYEVYVNDGLTEGYLTFRESNDTSGKFRIKRSGNNFEFYTWNQTAWLLETSSTLDFPETLYIAFESETSYPSWGLVNATWDDFNVNAKNFSVAFFNSTEINGEYQVNVIAIDNFDAVNDSETTNFTIQFSNDRPSVPFLLRPSPNEIVSGIYKITWSDVFDYENDKMRYNITLLNPDYTVNQTIVEDYGNSTTNFYFWNTLSIPEGNYSIRITVYENETAERYSNSFTLLGYFILNKPPSVIINSPKNQTYCGQCAPISINATDINGIDKAIAEITLPNGTIENLNLDYAISNDSFDNGMNWFLEETIDGQQNCTSYFDGKAFLSIQGNGTLLKDTTCTLISKRGIDSDFDISIDFNVTNYSDIDSAVNFVILPRNSSSESPIYMFISLSEWSGLGRNYEIYVNNGTFSDYLETKPANDTSGKFRIKRSGNNFEFYIWNQSQWQLEASGNFVFPRIVFIGLEAESAYPKWGSINVTFDNFTVQTNNFLFALYHAELQGLHNITFFVNDTLGAVNNTEKTNFTSFYLNMPPTQPFILEPYPGMIVGNTITIVWSDVYDFNNDTLRYNITLLNLDQTVNATITTEYGDASTNYYIWSTHSISDGNYLLRIDVYENQTQQRLKNNYTMSSYFVIDNTKPLVFFVHPTPQNNTIINKTFIEVNVTAIDANMNYIDIFVFNQSNHLIYDDEMYNSTAFFNVTDLNEQNYSFYSIAYDLSVNSNSTGYSNVEIDFTQPFISINNPTNKTYNYNLLLLNITTQDKNLNKTFYKWNSSGYIEYQGEVYINFNEGTNFIEVLSYDKAGNSNKTNLTFTVDTLPPYITFHAPTPLNNSMINKNWVYVNLSADATDVLIEWMGLNESMSFNGFWFINKSSLLDGLYSYRIFAKDQNENWNYTGLYYVRIDTKSPQWSNNISSPLSAIQYNQRSYTFNITWQDENQVSYVSIENNFTGTLQNDSVIANGNEYYYVTNNLKPANYVFRFYANDSADNWNKTDQWVYIVERNSTQIRLYINNSESDITLPLQSFVNITAYIDMNGLIKVHSNLTGWQTQEGIGVVENITQLIVKGKYNVTAEFLGNENYTYSSKTLFLTAEDFSSPYYTFSIQNNSWIGVGHSILLAANWSDNYDLDYAWLETNETGVWKTQSYVDINLTSGQTWSNFSWSNSSIPAGTVIAWRIHANDTTGNENYTDTMMFAVNASEIWKFLTNGFIYSSPAIGDVDGDGNIDVVFTSYDRKLYALIGYNGTKLFEFLTNNSIASSPSLLTTQESYMKIITASYDGNVYAVNGSSGSRMWNFTTGGLIFSSPAIYDINNDNIPEIIIGSYDRNIYVLNSTNGEKIWNYTTGNRIISSPSVVSYNGDVIISVGSHDGKLYALNSTGDLLWQFSMQDKIESSPAIDDLDGDGNYEIAVGSYDNKTYLVNATNGQLIWSYTTGNWITSSPVIANIAGQKKVIIASHDSKVYSLNSDGTLNWTFAISTGGRIQSSPSIIDLNFDGVNDVLVGCSDSRIYALNGLNGNVIWSYKVNAYIFSSPAIADINSDGTNDFVFGSLDRYQYSLDPPAWSVFGGNERRTRIFDNAEPELVYFEIDNQSNTVSTLWKERFSNLDYAIISENSTGYSSNHFVKLKGTHDWVNFTFYSKGVYFDIKVFDEYNNSNFIQGFIEGETDKKPPQWHGNQSTQFTYRKGAEYNFVLNWTDESGVEIILFENNFTGVLINQTDASLKDLPAGVYKWKSYAKDYLNNWNSTEEYYLIISKADVNMNFTVENVTYPDKVNVFCNGDHLYRNNTLIPLVDNSSLPAGVWNYTCIKNDDQNYTYIPSTLFVFVFKATPKMELNAKYDEYCPSNVKINAYEANKGDIDVIYKLSNSTHEFYGSNITLSFKSLSVNHTFNYSSSGGMNWTAGQKSINFVIKDNKPPENVYTRVKFVNQTFVIESLWNDRCSPITRSIVTENSLGFFRNHTIYGNDIKYAFEKDDLKDLRGCKIIAGLICVKLINYKITAFDSFDNFNSDSGYIFYYFYLR
ncbi:MAG: PQQ-binding-like beta-propeller repeat protein [Candidatus Aenigmarchaeota archaeon]|nr:PQQ-binding-like beta-propeller repeat protein [Candidatus Aenigmarchaeota archaeon]